MLLGRETLWPWWIRDSEKFYNKLGFVIDQGRSAIWFGFWYQIWFLKNQIGLPNWLTKFFSNDLRIHTDNPWNIQKMRPIAKKHKTNDFW